MGIASVIVLGCGVPAAHALIVQDMASMPRPPKGYMGRYNGSSGTAIAARWLISAKHCGGGVGSSFILRGETFTVVEAVLHPTMDVQLLRVDRTMPGWHALAETVSVGQRVVMAGWGRTAGAVLAGNTGYNWAGPWQESWGENKLSFVGSSLGTTFDAPGSANAVAFESQAAMNDSGGAIFTVDPNGTLRLAGVITSVNRMNEARYGDSTYCVNLVPIRSWIVSIIGTLSVISHGVQGDGGTPVQQTTPAALPSAPKQVSGPRRTDRRAARSERLASGSGNPGTQPHAKHPTHSESAASTPKNSPHEATRASQALAPTANPSHRTRSRGTDRAR